MVDNTCSLGAISLRAGVAVVGGAAVEGEVQGAAHGTWLAFGGKGTAAADTCGKKGRIGEASPPPARRLARQHPPDRPVQSNRIPLDGDC
jgi:hypothetical protein